MKSNKVKVFEFIKEYSITQSTDEYPKLTTQYLSEKLDMQRTNLSSILNQLVKEGKITKTTTRPVLYQLANFQLTNQKDFENLIGYNQSLNEAVMLAKAAILYPQGSPHILLTAESGSGVKYFAKNVYDFAVKSKVLKNNAPFTVFDCKTFIENPTIINEMLYGDEVNTGLVHQTNQGMLLIKHVELLSGYQRTMLFSIITSNKMPSNQYVELPRNYKCIMLCAIASDASKDLYDLYRNKMDFVIELLPLSQRPLKERFALLELFLKQEARKLDRVLEVSTNILHSLLLYEVKDNIRGLKNDIHTGVANCYVREHDVHHLHIELLLSDFPNYVRKGMIYYKTFKEEIDEIIPGDCKFAFTKNEVLKNRAKENNANIYRTIDVRKKELKKQSVSEEQINTLVSLQLHQDFQEYLNELSNRVSDKEQLSKIVSMKLISLVERFITRVSSELAINYQENILYGLCLHINASLIKVSSKQRLANEEIKRMIDLYPKHYHLAKEFVHEIEEEFRVKMNIDEIIFTMLFILNESKPVTNKHVVTLIAMHGDSSASSIVNVVNALAMHNNTYAYDLPLDKSMDDAYEDLKEQIIKVDQGKGIILIYDMGSIRTMAESIAFETKIEIKYLEMPVTLIGVTSSNKASNNDSVDEIYEYLQTKFKDIKYFRKQSDKKILVIISKEQSEVTRLKSYLNEHFDLSNVTVHVIENSEANHLYNEINIIANEGKIIGIIGNNRPNLAQYPFAEVRWLEQKNAKTLEEIFIEEDEARDDINEIFEYLKDQFNEVDVDGIKDYLLDFTKSLEVTLDATLDEDQQIGLIVHLVCLIDRISRHQAPIVNFIASNIILNHGMLVSKVKELLVPLEMALNISISDAEIATIISIVKKR